MASAPVCTYCCITSTRRVVSRATSSPCALICPSTPSVSARSRSSKCSKAAAMWCSTCSSWLRTPSTPCRVGESAISRIAATDASIEARVARPLSVSSVNESSSRAERSASAWNRSSLEFEEALDGLVAREQRDDALLLGRASAPAERQISPAISRIRAVACSSMASRPSARRSSTVRSTAAAMRISPGVMRGSSSYCSSRRNSRRDAPACCGEAVGPCSSMTSLAIWGRRGVRREEHRSRPGATHVSAAGKTRDPRRRSQPPVTGSSPGRFAGLRRSALYWSFRKSPSCRGGVIRIGGGA